jgi:hypothetical protein
MLTIAYDDSMVIRQQSRLDNETGDKGRASIMLKAKRGASSLRAFNPRQEVHDDGQILRQSAAQGTWS